jgi:hypothetical protein
LGIDRFNFGGQLSCLLNLSLLNNATVFNGKIQAAVIQDRSWRQRIHSDVE